MNDSSTLTSHRNRVACVATQIRSRKQSKIALSSKGRVGHCVRRNHWKHNCSLIDVSTLTHVLSTKTATKICIVEPGITFEHLCQHLLPFGLLPLVIPEFKNITVGGAVLGLGVESSSFQHGLFEDSVVSMDVLNGKGDIIHVTKSCASDLFYGMFGSYGSMGVLVAVEIQLMAATSSVQLTYTPTSVKTLANGECWWPKDANPDCDFCEAIVFSKTKASVITATFTERNAPNTFACYTTDTSHWRFWWGRWFFQHAEQKRKVFTEIVPTLDYLFRHDRGIFWCAQVRGVGTSICERVIHGWYWSSSTAYHTEHKSNTNNDFFRIVQDIAIPIKHRRLERFLHFLDSTLNTYPLWLCPIRNKCHTAPAKIFSLPMVKDNSNENGEKDDANDANDANDKVMNEFYVNVGIYASPSHWDGRPFHLTYVTAHRAMEDTTRRLRGRKGLYSTSYYTKEEFNQEYDLKRAEDLREKYHCKCCVDVYTKCCESNIFPTKTTTTTNKED